MTLNDAEQSFLARQPLGYLATVGPDGHPQVKPVGFTYNAALGTIDIAGYNMSSSAKYRNVSANPHVAFVVDEVTEHTMQGAHFLEIRGAAETTHGTHGKAAGHLPPEIIRIHPRRVLSFNVDPAQHGLAARDISPAADNQDLQERRSQTASRPQSPPA
jgi:pyridoxamine 5'-phosphate oxidase family protein